jgi:hypothetical protein
LNLATRQPAAGPGRKQALARLFRACHSIGLKVTTNCRRGLPPDWRDAFLPSLPDYPNSADLEIHIHHVEPVQFGEAQARGVEQFEYGPVSQKHRMILGHRLKQLVNLVTAQKRGQLPPRSPGPDESGRVVSKLAGAMQKPEKYPYGGQLPGYRCRGPTARIEISKPRTNREPVHHLPSPILDTQPATRKTLELIQVAPVGVDRMWRQPAFALDPARKIRSGFRPRIGWLAHNTLE